MRCMHDVSGKIIQELPERLLISIFGNFAREKGWMKKASFGGTDMTVPITMAEMDEQQESAWQQHIALYEMSRE